MHGLKEFIYKMSIIISGGFASGLRMRAPKTGQVRPTGVRSRRALLDSLGTQYGWNGKVVVDLFAGSGALGLDAVSRGAAEVYLIDKDKKGCSFAEKNSEAVKKSAGSERCPQIYVVCTDVRNAEQRLWNLSGKIDFIFADPPYRDSERYFNVLTFSDTFTEWAGNALMLWESPGGFRGRNAGSLWKIIERRKFAGTEFLYLKSEKFIN
jgi:16S rRNA (guanine(966)-N(2))-methyltransferase RsmD